MVKLQSTGPSLTSRHHGTSLECNVKCNCHMSLIVRYPNVLHILCLFAGTNLFTPNICWIKDFVKFMLILFSYRFREDIYRCKEWTSKYKADYIFYTGMSTLFTGIIQIKVKRNVNKLILLAIILLNSNLNPLINKEWLSEIQLDWTKKLHCL